METCAYLWKCPGYAPDRPGAYFGRVFFMEKAPWSISSSLRMKFQTTTGVRSSAGHWYSDRETMLTGLRNIAMARFECRISEAQKPKYETEKVEPNAELYTQ